MLVHLMRHSAAASIAAVSAAASSPSAPWFVLQMVPRRSLPLVGHRYAPDDASVRRYRQLSTVCLFASTWALPLKLVVGSDRR